MCPTVYVLLSPECGETIQRRHDTNIKLKSSTRILFKLSGMRLGGLNDSTPTTSLIIHFFYLFNTFFQRNHVEITIKYI